MPDPTPTSEPTPVAPAAPAAPEPKAASPLGGEPKPAEPKPAEPTAPAEPIKYDFKVPEGLALDDKTKEALAAYGNKYKLAPEAAQELLDWFGKDVSKPLVEQVTKAVTEANAKAFNDLIGGWKGEIDKDPELSGANREPAQAILGQMLDTYGSKEAREAFDLTGAGWNPHIVRMILKMGKALAEGQPATPGSPVGKKAPTSPGERLYPDAKAN